MNLVRTITELASRHPTKPAFVDDKTSVTFEDLAAGALKLAGLIETVSEGTPKVAIFLPRGVEAAVAIYGVLFAGGTYIPLDIGWPRDRVNRLLSMSGAEVVIGYGEKPDFAAGSCWIDCTSIGFEKSDQFRPKETDPEQIAVLLYTSGSSGTPKGVAISHRAIQAFVDWSQTEFELSESDRAASLSPFHFDLSLFDLFSVPLASSTTLFVPDKFKLSPAKLTDWLVEQSISCWYTVPSILSFLAYKGGLQNKNLPALRLILFAGEVFPVKPLRVLCDYLPSTRMYNLFGPTETNVCSFWEVNRKKLSGYQQIPIGVPACNAELDVDPATGELLVKSPCLMSGYWNGRESELELRKGGWYPSGDKVLFDENKDLLYLGRLDRMLKVSGYRVEPAEIEQVLQNVDQVQNAVVLGMTDQVSGSRLLAVLAGPKLDEKVIRRVVREQLPAYMQPSRYTLLESMPLLPNGKIDYQLLLESHNDEGNTHRSD